MDKNRIKLIMCFKTELFLKKKLKECWKSKTCWIGCNWNQYDASL